MNNDNALNENGKLLLSKSTGSGTEPNAEQELKH